VFCPHLRFAAYLTARKLPLDRFIKDLPIPDIAEITGKFPNITLKTAWLNNARLNMFHKRHSDAETAYMLWQNAETRAFLMACAYFKQDPIATLESHFRILATEQAIQWFYEIFMDIDGADIIDLREYADHQGLGGIDSATLRLCLDKKTWTYIQDTLGIRPRDINHDDILEGMFVKMYKKWEETEDLKYANALLRVQRELRDKKNVAKKNAHVGVERILQEFDAKKKYLTLEQLRESSPSEHLPSLRVDPS